MADDGGPDARLQRLELMKHVKEVSVETRVQMPDGVGQLPAARPATPVVVRVLRGAVALASLGALRSRSVDVDALPVVRAVPKVSLYRLSFVGVVVIPSLIAWAYLAFIASDQYAAEARFAVRTALSDGGEKGKGDLGAVAAGGTPSLASQDAYVVTTYINSHAAIADLSKTMDIRAIFTRPEADFWARLKRNASAEQLLAYWRGMVSANVDGPSGIVTVKVRAFRPADALALAGAITTASEHLINEVSARARADSMRRAEEEVRSADAKVHEALAAMRAFRDKQGYIDPTVKASSTAQLLAQLMADKIQMENDVFVADRSTLSNAPQMKSMQARLAGVDQQIEQLKSEMTGDAVGNVASSLPEFEGLELQRTFSEKLYGMAQDALERARRKAEQQNVYVSEFVSPSLPEEAQYPERLSLSLIIPIVLLIIWGIMSLMAAAVDDHRY